MVPAKLMVWALFVSGGWDFVFQQAVSFPLYGLWVGTAARHRRKTPSQRIARLAPLLQLLRDTGVKPDVQSPGPLQLFRERCRV